MQLVTSIFCFIIAMMLVFCILSVLFVVLPITASLFLIYFAVILFIIWVVSKFKKH